MTSIGNDIIALKTIDISRTRSFRFYSKILSVSEQQLYQEQFTAIPFELFVWLLWSVKESVYKCLQRHQPNLIFSPVKIELKRLIVPAVQSSSFHGQLANTGFTDSECFCSEIRLGPRRFSSRSVIYGDEAIFTVAQPAEDCHAESVEPSGADLRQTQADNTNFSDIHWGIKQINSSGFETQSAAVREFLLEILYILYPGRELRIIKNDAGCPFLFVDGQAVEQRISLSHHGEYVGYALA
jgi:phosphopantetheinyl transferase (holo-ACP synthase)